MTDSTERTITIGLLGLVIYFVVGKLPQWKPVVCVRRIWDALAAPFASLVSEEFWPSRFDIKVWTFILWWSVIALGVSVSFDLGLNPRIFLSIILLAIISILLCRAAITEHELKALKTKQEELEGLITPDHII